MRKTVFSLLCAISYLSAQSTTGTLVGTVTDATGAVVRGAKVRVTNEGTGITVDAATGDTGDYVAANLPAASYKIRIESPGFRATEVTGITLLLNATVRNDVRLEAGAIEQSVTVSAAAPVISSETSSIASVIDSHSVASLPVNGRTLDRFILISAGNTSDSSSNPKLAGSLHWGGNYFTIDGVGFNDLGNGGAAYSYRTSLSTTPSIDTIQEFKIETTNAKAEYEGSAAISIISKSGTNNLHGSLFEFNRNRVAAAKNFFATGQPKPAFNRNEFGATVGGPIIKNRTFFFGSYEGLRQRTASTPFLSYGTAAMRSGDFSGLAAIRDPLSNDNFPNNRIPTSRLDPRVQQLLGFVPVPNTIGPGPAGTGANYVTSVPNIIDVNRYSARVDHQLTSKDALSAILNYSKGSPYFVYNGGPNQFGNFSDGGYITKSATLGYTRSISAATINEFRYAYFSHASIRVGQNLDFNPATLFPQLYQPLPLGGLPTMTITGFSGITDSGGSARAPEIVQQLTDNFTFVRGKHTFKAGGDIGFNRVATNPSAGSTQFGNFSFNGRYSNNAYADFLLGYPVTALRGTPGLVNLLYNTRYGAYFQDDWKVSPRLTLNLGVRYLLQTAEQERDGSFANFDFGTGKYVIRSVNGQTPRLAIPRLLAAYPYVTSEQEGWGSDVLLSDRNNFAPRFGFAWRPFGGASTVVRGGYGIYYNVIPVFIGIRQISLTNTPFQLSESFEAAAGNTPSLTLANPFPGQGALSPNPNITAVNRQVSNTYAQQWNLTVERELIKDLGLRLSYIGNKAARVPWYTYQRNLPVTQAAGTIQSQRPYQPWADISTLDTNGNSITHQFQAEITRRYRSGLFLNANYTWNKTLDNVPIASSPQNPYNVANDRGNGESIRHHVFYLSSTYDLPFGPGKRFASRGGAAGKIIGGWGLSGILQLRSGTPFSVNFSPTLAGWYANRANTVSSNFYPDQQSTSQWFNPSAFAVPAPFTFGNSSRNMLFGPGQNLIDMSVLKTTKIRERVSTEFRAEFFNLPNHPSFNNPAANISVPATVGRITSTSVEPRAIQFGLKLLF
jgi:hypothetical protein